MSMFVLVGSKEPLYKMELKSRKEESAHVDEFLLHSALDIVDELMWTTQSMALKVVDKFNDQFVSAFVTATSVKFLLLHESRNEDTIRAFFHEVHELYLKVSALPGYFMGIWWGSLLSPLRESSQLLMNPFYEYDTPITSEVFDARIKTLARRYL
jgi:trafficking protein particle complex subunit 2